MVRHCTPSIPRLASTHPRTAPLLVLRFQITDRGACAVPPVAAVMAAARTMRTKSAFILSSRHDFTQNRTRYALRVAPLQRHRDYKCLQGLHYELWTKAMVLIIVAKRVAFVYCLVDAILMGRTARWSRFVSSRLSKCSMSRCTAITRACGTKQVGDSLPF